jgi:ferredoxin--NADP+ reductase
MTEQRSYNIAIVGAGPAALYAAQKLDKEGHRVVIVNRDIKHGGLAEFGIYPNKYKMKTGLRRMFKRILDSDNVTYFGNVLVGDEGSISLEDLRELGFDALVVAVGAQGTKWLGLPGEELGQVYHAKDLVYHYNGLPPFSEREFPIGDEVCIVGIGNVCLDIVHWLVIEKKVTTVTAVARRGPAERAYTEKEMKIVSGALDVEQVRADIEANREHFEAVDQDVETLVQEVTQHADIPLEEESPTRFQIRFLRSPVRIEGTTGGDVTGLVCEKTKLGLRDDGTTRSVGLDEFETIPCDTVVFAIGDSIEPSIGLPLEPKWQSNFCTVPQPWEAEPERDRYMVYDPDDEEPIWDCFVVGWARKASDGLVGKARADAVHGCDEVLAYLRGDFPEGPEDPHDYDELVEGLADLLGDRGVEFVTWEDVLRLVEAEEQIAEERGLPEFKFTTNDEMLARIREAE